MQKADWSKAEVDTIVGDYFSMLRSELLNETYSKSDHRRSVSPRLDSRSDGSIEFKHQNISAVLVELGLPYIEGYKPRGNFQLLLLDGVRDYLDNHSGMLDELAAAPILNPHEVTVNASMEFESVIEHPPERSFAAFRDSKPWINREIQRVDFAERDAMNRRQSMLGESWVTEVERHRLRTLHRDDLARKVEWVSHTIGDGLGFDVLSFNATDGSERLIEVKTTGLGKYFSFYVTRNEVRCSVDVGPKFYLYRVFDFSRTPRAFVLRGSLQTSCHMESVQFRATVGEQRPALDHLDVHTQTE